MTHGALLRVRLLTPERAVFEGAASGVVFPSGDGLRGVLPGHAQQIGRIGVGTAEIRAPGEGARRFFLSGGFYEARPDALLLLSAEAVSAASLDRAAAERALAEARALPVATSDQRRARDGAERRARAMLRALGKS